MSISVKEYIDDNGFKSRKFLLVLFSMLLFPALAVAWALTGWPIPLYSSLEDALLTLVLGFCGISATRAMFPVASTMIAKTIQNNKTPQHVRPTGNPAGVKDQI